MSVVKISCGLTEWVISMGVAFAALSWSVKYQLPMSIAVELSNNVDGCQVWSVPSRNECTMRLCNLSMFSVAIANIWVSRSVICMLCWMYFLFLRFFRVVLFIYIVSYYWFGSLQIFAGDWRRQVLVVEYPLEPHYNFFSSPSPLESPHRWVSKFWVCWSWWPQFGYDTLFVIVISFLNT